MEHNIPDRSETTEMTQWSGSVDEIEVVAGDKPGYITRSFRNRSYHLPAVLEHEQEMRLGPILKADLNDALEMPGGVRDFVDSNSDL